MRTPNPETAAAPDNRNKKVLFKSCAPFTSCISKVNNAQVDNTKDIDVVMRMYNLIEYSDIHSKTTGSLWQYYRDEPALENNGCIIGFPADNNFWRTLEITLTNCEIDLFSNLVCKLFFSLRYCGKLSAKIYKN